MHRLLGFSAGMYAALGDRFERMSRCFRPEYFAPFDGVDRCEHVAERHRTCDGA